MATLPLTARKALHELAMRLLEEKNSKIPNYMRKPTIYDIYFNETNILYPTIPRDIQIDYFYRHFNEIVVYTGGRVTKDSSQSYHVTRALWYWRLDREHQFSSRESEIRYNVILICFMLVAEEKFPQYEKFSSVQNDARSLSGYFLRAWYAHMVLLKGVSPENQVKCFGVMDHFIQLWKTSEYDLTRYNNSQRRRMDSAIQDLKTKVLPTNLPIGRAFIEETVTKTLTAEQLDRYGPALALTWYLAEEEDVRNIQADNDMQTLDARVSLLGVDDNISDEQLMSVNFDSELIQALLVPIDYEGARERPARGRTWWIEPEAAISILSNDVDALGDLLGDLRL